ncbi:hypothetical protein Skr01_54030 [Sphaerisporangium krabiense]|uniref:Nucleoside diphosphate kinase-like domain-containing protein n=1 Tax=Sphaerisporangium krabiense TaxID=763782 RepID=A0A7W9DR82_9ACTN|nr:nucleoside-diphosphate kinase [Sphaerisporangium krabiense]MBB5627160.1 hypothetical protein [Sphaerisporangium krabiense]GII65318.1 hypothetical protein Skr01_54030 [Sphaerisporangium krabiense]
MTALADAALDTSDVPEEYCAALTRAAVKAELYRTDPYFRHGAFRTDVGDALATTFVVAKPDAVAGRRIPPVLEFLDENGFAVVAAARFRFTPLLTREVWRYQFNIASWARAEVVDLLLPAGDSLLLILRDTLPATLPATKRGPLPAACRLAALKGAADPRSRRGDNLRTRLGGPTTLFNFVHTADEPADVVRELALLELATGAPLIATARRTGPVPDAELSAAVQALHDACPAHDLDARASLRRLAACPDERVARLARRALDGDPSAGWSALLDLFPGRTPPAPLLWDVLSVATGQIESNVPGLAPQIPTVAAHTWLDDPGETPTARRREEGRGVVTARSGGEEEAS